MIFKLLLLLTLTVTPVHGKWWWSKKSKEEPTTQNLRHLSGGCTPMKINFGDLTRGEYVDAQYSGYGITFSATGGYGNKPRVFDTSTPGTAADGDPDLGR